MKLNKKKLRIVFATFSPWENNKRSPTNGMVEPMIYFFVPKTEEFALIDQPHPGSDRVLPIIEVYKNHKLKKITQSSLFVSWLYPLLLLHNTLRTSLVFKIRDFLSVLDFMLKKRGHYDIFIGLESINAVAGVLLKKFGFVETVVYYVTYFSPERYGNSITNKLYLFMDRVAFKYADFVWDISNELMTARIAGGLNSKTSKVPIYVPSGLFPKQINFKSTTKVMPASIVFAGTPKKENGPDLAIHAFKKVLRSIPNAKLHIFTSREDIDTQDLRDLTDELGIHENVLFHGLISNQTELISDLRKFMIGLAPYRAFPGSPRWWADATRIRLYLAAGLPVVTTHVPPISKELKQNNSGLVVKDNSEQLAKAIISLLKYKNLYRKMRQNAILQAKSNTWDKIYSRAIRNMGISL